MQSVLRFVRGTVQNSPWLVIAVALHAIVAAAVSVVYVRREMKKEPVVATSIAIGKSREVVEPLAEPEPIERKMVPKNERAEVVSQDELVEFVPSEDPPEEVDLRADLGDPNAIDDAPPAGGNTPIGVGPGGRRGAGGPSPFPGRPGGKGEGGKHGRTPDGPLQGIEAHVLDGLIWLARHQSPDGSWSAVGLRERCTPGRPCIPADVEVQPFYDEGLTALALLAFLGAGYTHESKQVFTDKALAMQYSIGDVVRRGLRWLVERQHADGSFSATRPFLYNEALCAMALSEAYGLTRGAGKRAWRRSAQRAVDFLVAAQKKSPEDGALWGWRYASRARIEEQKSKGEIDDETYFVEVYDSDISVTGWVIMALKSARISGLDVPEEALQGGLRYARHVSLPDGRVGYQEPEDAGKAVPGLRDEYAYHVATMSALGMLVRTFVEHDLEDPFLEEAAKQIVKDLPFVSKDELSVDYYYWYYGSLALNQFDGPESPRRSGSYWEPWKKSMEAALIELQDGSREKDACSRGGWLVDDRWSHAGRALYNTAINTLTLEVYYRYENAFGVGRMPSAASAAPRGPAGPDRASEPLRSVPARTLIKPRRPSGPWSGPGSDRPRSAWTPTGTRIGGATGAVLPAMGGWRAPSRRNRKRHAQVNLGERASVTERAVPIRNGQGVRTSLSMKQVSKRLVGALQGAVRNSPWLMIAIAIHAILGAGAAVFYVAHEMKKDEVTATAIRISDPRENKEPVVPPVEKLDRKLVPKNEEAELVSYEEETFQVSEEPLEEQDLHLDVGDPDSLDEAPPGATGGTSFGVGNAPGHYGSGMPSGHAGRRLGGGGHGRRTGATQGTEEAVLEGLRWLARHQNEGGSWGALSFATHCTTEPPCMPRESELGTTFDTGMTALALLAFLGQGLSIDSRIEIVDTAMGTKRKSGDIVMGGVKWLMEQQKEDGSFSSTGTFESPENDTLSTMALCEAFGLARNPTVRMRAKRALAFLIDAQKRDPTGARTGWGIGSYADLASRRDAGELDDESFALESQVVDPTVTCWVVTALQSARMCGLEVPDDVLDGALAYTVGTTATEDVAVAAPRPDDEFVYHAAKHRALGMLTRTFAGGPITDPYLERGARELAEDVPVVTKDKLSIDFYYWYFGTLALNQYDGPDSPRQGAGADWERWNKGLVAALLPLQDTSNRRDVCSRGGWLQETYGNRAGLEMRNTALNIMTLEVYYRFENVFGSTMRKRN